MKNFIVTLAITLSIFSCNNNDDDTPTELIGSWLLIEQYADPGDGSGDFVSVNSNKTIAFGSDGSIVSNGTLCFMSIASDTNSSGTYDIMENTINPDSDCNNGGSGIQLSYELIDNRLVLHFPCIEACSEKFRKIN